MNSQTTTVQTFDNYGNPSVVNHDVTSYPTVTVTTSYTNDPANWILGRINSVLTTQGSTPLSLLINIWTGNSITQKNEWLSTTSGFVSTQMTPDA